MNDYQDKHLENRQYIRYGLWLIVAALSFLTTLSLPYIGEEAVYTLTSLEMAANHEWRVPLFYGTAYTRPPLFNWLIISLAHLLGWAHVLIASRLVTMVATVCTGILLMWLVQKFFKNKTLTLFCALVYLSGDMLFRRGWLAYADPLFSFFVFGAIACLWVAIEENRHRLLFFSALGLIASFLTKALTGYVFYAVAVIVLFYRYYSTKRFFLLFKPLSLILHGIAIAFPFVWNAYVTEGEHGSAMVHDMLAKLSFVQFKTYILKVLGFPFDVFLRWAPVSIFLVYFWAQNRFRERAQNNFPPKLNQHAKTALWIVILNLMPYWLAPETHARYIMPLYPLIAFALGYWIWQLGNHAIRATFLVMSFCIVLRYVVGMWAFPYYEAHYRGNYKVIAQDILSITQGKPLYVNDVTSVGISVAAQIETISFPDIRLTFPGNTLKKGFLISHIPDFPHAHIQKVYTLGSQKVYLLVSD